jgi:hypothetical protein
MNDNIYYDRVDPELAATYNNLHNQPTAAQIEPGIIYHLVGNDSMPGSISICCYRDAERLPKEDRVTLSEQVCNCPAWVR